MLAANAWLPCCQELHTSCAHVECVQAWLPDGSGAANPGSSVFVCCGLQAAPTKPSPAAAVPSKQTKLLDSSVADELQAKRVAAQRRGKPLARWDAANLVMHALDPTRQPLCGCCAYLICNKGLVSQNPVARTMLDKL